MTRAIAVALAGTTLLVGMPPSSGDTAPPPPLLPLATCDTRVTDGPNDGNAQLSVIDVQPVPIVTDPRGNVPGLDITAITLRVTATRVYAFMNVTDIPDTLRQTDSAYSYIMWFSRNGKVARFDQVYSNAALQGQGLAPTSGFSSASVGTTTAGGEALTGVGGGVDKAKNVAYVYADRAALEAKTGGAIAPGDEVTAIGGRTELWETDGKSNPGVTRRPADTTNAPADKSTWQVGDERCFPASNLGGNGPTPAITAQYGDALTFGVYLRGEGDAPLAGRTVTFTLPGESAPRESTTDSAGLARVTLAAAPVAGTYQIKGSYAGDDVSAGAANTWTVNVRPETIRIAKLAVKKSGTTRIVTATLTEDDPRAFAKQPVAWYVNGKKVATLTTDSAGRSVFKGAKPGQKVQARYLGSSGKYAAATSSTVTV